MTLQSNLKRRGCMGAIAAAMLVLAWVRTVPLTAWQAAVSLSRPGQEGLTFWATHNGLEQYEVEGEVGFGDLARILLRRRANAEPTRALRDRFTFRTRDIAELRTPDVFRAEITDSGVAWANQPRSFVAAAAHTFNLPLVIVNRTGHSATVEARFANDSMASGFPATQVGANSAAAFFLRAVEPGPGMAQGRLTLRADGREIGASLAFDVRPLVNLRVHLIDTDGKPAAARVYLTGSDGLAYAPRGSISRITAMSAEYYFHAEDSFQIALPSGTTTVEATCGPEYRIVSKRVELAADHDADVRIQLERWENMAAKGWYSSDAHIHANYTAPHHQVITPDDVRLQAVAEDLNNANMMVANSGGAFLHDVQYFQGRPHSLSSANFILYWNEEMRNSGMYGHMCFFSLRKLVAPLYTGFRNTPFWEDYPPNYNLAADAESQGGAVTYAHPAMNPVFDVASARELPVDLALAKVDAMDVLSNDDEIAAMTLWYHLLNCGLRLAISAGTDSFTNVADHYTLGGGRVYVDTGGPLRYAEWIRNYKRGRSFASNGPMIFFTVDGRPPGDELRFDAAAPRAVRVKASVHTEVPLDRIELIVNGRPAISRKVNGEKEITIDEPVALAGSSWLAVRALGPWSRPVLNDIQAFAHTSPVYVYFRGQRIVFQPDVQFYVDWVKRLIARVDERGRFATPERKREVMDLLGRALAIYEGLQRIARPPA